MSGSLFRQDLEQAFRRTARQPLSAKTEAVFHVLRSHEVLRRSGSRWAQSRLAPTVAAIWERGLEDPGLAALVACEWMEHLLGLGLVAQGLLADDGPALAWLNRTRPPDTPPVENLPSA